MHARSIALSGRGPNEVTLECNDRLIVRRGSQLGRATAARSRRPYLGAFISQGFGDDFIWRCAIGGVRWRTLGIGMRIAGLGAAFS